MPSSNHITRRRFGRWTVLAFHSATPYGKHSLKKFLWLCQCDCGTQKLVQPKTLFNGDSTSCGCYKLDYPHFSHGHTRYGIISSEYQAWRAMLARCYNPNNPAFKYYGARGITVCARWKNNFQNFLNDMGPRPSKLYSLNRINNNGNYKPKNCEWATDETQMNNRSNNIVINGTSLKNLALQYSIPYPTLYSRLKTGWPLPRALNTPVRIYKPKIF